MSFLLRVIVVVSWLIFAVQSADWCLVDNTISYQESTNCSQTGFNIGIDYNLGNAVKFNFIESCCVSSTMYLLDDGQETTTKSISFSTPTQLTNFQFCEENTNTLTHIYLQNSNNMLLLFFGCSSSVSDSIVDLLRYDMDSFIWSSQDNSFILSLVDYYSSPYVYIDGVTKPIVALNIKTSSSPNYNQFLYFASGNFIVGDVTNWGVVVSYFTNVTLCERENFGRYGVISSYVELPDSDCGCIPQGSKLSDGYSYPDCNYNNSLLDLTISDTQLTLEIDTSQTDWNTLSFTSTITLTSETFSTLSLNNFSIDEDKLFVSEHPIIVNKLNINGVGNYFFNSISILDLEFTTSFEKNVVIFTGTANDLSSYGISVYCGSRYALDNSDIDCSCYYDNGFTQMDCEYTSRESTNLQNLELYSDVNLTLERYWGTITTFIPSISITGNTNAEVCNFESSKVEINGYINCTTLVIGESTEIIMNGILDVINIEINGNISNLNSNGIIQLQNGSSNFSNIQSIVMNSSECVEFMSFKESQNNFTNTFFDDINVYLLSINKLIRFCKTENMDVDCIVNVDNFFDEYDVIHCPCNDINCTLRIETPTLNFLKEDILSHMIAYQNTTFIDVTSINTIEFNSSLTILLTGIETSIENIVSSTQNITLLIQTPTTINSYYIPTLIPLSETTITNTITEIENLVIYSNHHQVIISDSVNTLTIKEITLKESLSTPILNCQQSTNPLIFSVPNTLSEYSIIDSVIIIEQKYRQLTSCTFSCDNQIVFINETGISCKDLGYFEHFCIYNSDYYDIYEKIDYSCPCNNEESWCIIKVDPLQSYFKPLYSIDSITFSSNLVLEMNYDILEVNSTTSEVELEIVGNNNVLSMTNESSNFYIVLSSLNMLIGFEKGFAIGSEKQFSNVENSLKSSYSIVVENGLSCKNMIYQDSQVSCIICDTFFNNNECVETVEIPSNCISFDSEKNVCIECVEGYYAERYECIPCASNCRRCNENLECILCENNFYINNGNCSNVNDFVEMYYHGKIMKCVDGMYVTSSGCDDCGKDCVSCISETSCTICNNTQESDGNCSILDGVEIATHLNSISCSDGYVFQMNQCVKCSDIFGNDCSTCAIDQCLSCETGVILSNGSCGTETGCVIIDSKCVGCINDSFMFDGYQCVSYFDNCEWCINFECVACVNGYFFGSDDMCYDSAVTECKVYDEHGNCIRCENENYMKKIVVEKQFNIKKISDYEEEFSNSVKMGNILVSKTDLLFQEEQINIPVKKISQDIIYVGNIGTKTAKIQLINTYVNSKYTISFEPPIAIVGPKKAAQFKVFITPLLLQSLTPPLFCIINV
ncbi:Serine/threonine kinase [Entamoeba marina]